MGASQSREEFSRLSAEAVGSRIESLGESYIGISKAIKCGGMSGDVIVDLSENELDDILVDSKLTLMQRKVLKKKLEFIFVSEEMVKTKQNQSDASLHTPEKGVELYKKSSRLNSVIDISWRDLTLFSGAGQKIILGHGSFGTVIKAVWKGRYKVVFDSFSCCFYSVDVLTFLLHCVPSKVAVKVFKSVETLHPRDSYAEACLAAETEARISDLAEQGVDSRDLMLKVYGIAKGPIPEHLNMLSMLSSFEGNMCVGLVMRYEGGGTLHSFLHPDPSSPRTHLSLEDKLRYMRDIAACISDMHTLGNFRTHIYFESLCD